VQTPDKSLNDVEEEGGEGEGAVDSSEFSSASDEEVYAFSSV
jgi:hypothetical protein